MRVVALLLLPTLAIGAPAPGVYDRAMKASLEILVDDHLSGSGFVIDSSGLAITAAHVVPDRTRRIEGLSPEAGRVDLEVIALDRGHDVALVRLPPRDAPYPSLPLGDRRPAVGEELYLLGAPIYRHGVMLRGAMGRDDLTYEFLPDEQYYLSVYHLSGPSPPGTSGGPWLDETGKVVGLQSGLMHDSGAPVGIAYMAPVQAMRRLLQHKRDAATASLDAAFEELWEHHADVLERFPPRAEGLLVAVLRPGGAAARAGLRLYDLITHADGRPVRLRDELLSVIRSKRPGEPVVLTISRGKGKPSKKLIVTTSSLEKR